MKHALHRRQFLTAQLGSDAPVRPPWMMEGALAACNGCSACVEACPSGLLRTVGGKPEVFFTSECTFCGACASACPEHLFDRSHRPFQHVVAIGDTCLARRGTICQSCRDACPETAIRFVPRRGGPFLPELSADACTGCGACISTCPVSAITITPFAKATDD